MSEKKFEDEFVRITANSGELIAMDFPHGRLEMEKCVVPLSEAIKTMDEFSKEVTEGRASEESEKVYF